MVMRVGGLASGMDIDALVEKLMNAEKTPLNKLQQKKQTYEWQRDAYRDVNTKLKALDTYIADNLVVKNISSKTASSSNSDLVSAVATGKAAGTLSIEAVSQLATSARSISDKQIQATGTTKLSDLGITDTSISLRAIQADGTMATNATKIDLDANMTIDQLMSKINSSGAGVSAIFESGKLSVTAKNTGDIKNGAEVVVDSGASMFGALGITSLEGKTSGDLASGGKNATFEVNGIVAERTTNTFSINGYNVTLKSTFNESVLVDTTKKNLDEALNTMADLYGHTYTSANMNTTEKYQQLADKLVHIISVRTDELNVTKNSYADAKNKMISGINNELSGKYNGFSTDTKNFLAELTAEERTELASLDLTNTQALNDSQLSTKQKELLNTLSTGNNQELLTLNSLNENDLNEVQNTVGNLYSSLTPSVISKLENLNYTDIQADTDISPEDKQIFARIDEAGFNELKTYHTDLPGLVSSVENANSALKNVEKDLDYLNSKGNEYIRAGNIASTSTSPQVSQVTLTATNNVDEMMNKIKDFVKTYNGLINDLNDQSKQTKYRDYAPLTDDQRKEMSENEIKLWEEKAKSGLLRNDSLVRTGLTNMRALVYQSNPGLSDSKYNTLYSIGITTTKNYNDGGQLEINEDKLRAAIESDPDAVERLFKNTEGKKEDVVDGKTVDTRGYIEKLRESMKKFEISIENKAGRSTMTEQQYTLGKNLVDTNKRIDSWKSKLVMIEERYWKQFNAMEAAINKSNSQSATLFPQATQ